CPYTTLFRSARPLIVVGYIERDVSQFSSSLVEKVAIQRLTRDDYQFPCIRIQHSCGAQIQTASITDNGGELRSQKRRDVESWCPLRPSTQRKRLPVLPSTNLSGSP